MLNLVGQNADLLVDYWAFTDIFVHALQKQLLEMCSSAHKESKFIYLSSPKAGVRFQLKDGFCYFHFSYAASSHRPITHKPLGVRNMDILLAFSFPLFIVTSACVEKPTIALSNLISVKDKEFTVNLPH